MHAPTKEEIKLPSTIPYGWKLKVIWPDGNEVPEVSPYTSLVTEFHPDDRRGFIEELKHRRFQSWFIQAGIRNKLNALLFGNTPDFDPKTLTAQLFWDKQTTFQLPLYHLITRPTQGITPDLLQKMVANGVWVIVYLQILETWELEAIREHYRITVLAKSAIESAYVLIQRHS